MWGQAKGFYDLHMDLADLRAGASQPVVAVCTVDHPALQGKPHHHRDPDLVGQHSMGDDRRWSHLVLLANRDLGTQIFWSSS